MESRAHRARAECPQPGSPAIDHHHRASIARQVGGADKAGRPGADHEDIDGPGLVRLHHFGCSNAARQALSLSCFGTDALAGLVDGSRIRAMV